MAVSGVGKALGAGLWAVMLSGAAVAQTSDGFGRDDRWTRGEGPAACESIVTAGETSHIYVTCACDGLPSGILFTIGGTHAGTGEVSLSFDDAPAETVTLESGTLWADCADCTPGFADIVAKLRRYNRVAVGFDTGAEARFTLLGSAAAIGNCQPVPPESG